MTIAEPVTEIETATDLDDELKKLIKEETSPPWQCIVYDDSVNTIEYVTKVLGSYFGFSEETARAHTLEIHHNGQSVVAHGLKEDMKKHSKALRGFGLTAKPSKSH